MTADVKRVYAFGKDAEGNNVTEGNKDMKNILGGKGANLAEMALIGLPVPPGFTITCQTCMEYANANNTWPEGALDTIQEYRLDLEKRIGKRIGDAEDPLLVSVRSGAPMSMPGMMDTVLNLGRTTSRSTALSSTPTTPASRGTAIVASSRCSRTWLWASMATCSKTPLPPRSSLAA